MAACSSRPLQSLTQRADVVFRHFAQQQLGSQAAAPAAGPAADVAEAGCPSSSSRDCYAAALTSLREAHAALKSEVASPAAAGSAEPCLDREWTEGLRETLEWLSRRADELEQLASVCGSSDNIAAGAAHTALSAGYGPWLWVLDAASEVVAAHGLPPDPAAGDATAAAEAPAMQASAEPAVDPAQAAEAEAACTRTEAPAAAGQLLPPPEACNDSARPANGQCTPAGQDVEPAGAKTARTKTSIHSSSSNSASDLLLTCPYTGVDVRACECECHSPQALHTSNASILVDLLVQGALHNAARSSGSSWQELPAQAAEAMSGGSSSSQDGAAAPPSVQLAMLAQLQHSRMDSISYSLSVAVRFLMKQYQQSFQHSQLRAALGSREVRRLQVALLERLAVHGGCSNSAGSSSSSAGGSSARSCQSLLSRYEALLGRAVGFRGAPPPPPPPDLDAAPAGPCEAGTADEGCDDVPSLPPTSAANDAAAEEQWKLEKQHVQWLEASFGGWAQAAAVWDDPPPPLALQMRLAARAAEALCRLSGCCCGSLTAGGVGGGKGGRGRVGHQGDGGSQASSCGLGGATYGPLPRFTAVCDAEVRVLDVLRSTKQLRALASRRAQVEALLPDALAGAAWWLRLQAAALQRRHQPAWLADVRAAGMEGGTCRRSGDSSSEKLAATAEAVKLWRSVALLLDDMTGAWSPAENGLMHGASGSCVSAALEVAQRTGLVRTLDLLLRLATEAQLTLHDHGRRSGGSGGGGGGASAARGSSGTSSGRSNTTTNARGMEQQLGSDAGETSWSVEEHAPTLEPALAVSVAVHKVVQLSGYITRLMAAAAGKEAPAAEAAVPPSAASGTSGAVGAASAGGPAPAPPAAAARTNATASITGGNSAVAATDTCIQQLQQATLGLMVSCAKRSLALGQRLAAVAAEGPPPAGSNCSGSGGLCCSSDRMCMGRCLNSIFAVESAAVGGVGRLLLASMLFSPSRGPLLRNNLGAAAAAGAPNPEGGGGPGATAAAAEDACSSASSSRTSTSNYRAPSRLRGAALEALMYCLRVACELSADGAPHLELCVVGTTGSALGMLMIAIAASFAADEAVDAEPSQQLVPHVLACQPHRVMATAADLLYRIGGDKSRDALDARALLIGALIGLLLTAGCHPQLSLHLLEWLAPSAPLAPKPTGAPSRRAGGQQAARSMPASAVTGRGAITSICGGGMAAAASVAAGAAERERLQGCLRERLRACLGLIAVSDEPELPSEVEASRAQAVVVATFLEIAACWARSPRSSRGSSGNGSSTSCSAQQAGGVGDGGMGSGVGASAAGALDHLDWHHEICSFASAVYGCMGVLLPKLAANTVAQGFGFVGGLAAAGCAGTPQSLAALVSLRMPGTGVPLLSLLSKSAYGDDAKAKKAAVAEKVRQRRLLQQQPQQQAPLPPHLQVEPAAVTLWRLRVCGNPGCEAFGSSSSSEAELDLRLCGRCKSVRYCSVACQAAHWRSGHGAVCARVAAAVAEVAEAVTEQGPGPGVIGVKD
ncbi:hypothetical protein HYH02_005572 [Chlamydomonas schloesseri]|uniref:MYND-type domain-containing protein n=1 Tax=Chlamydomonas schloesseri TaxID=2026947 RepID=A0A835WL21_9CHLO|nr:hypothetical protein HYH02_005572 [Chlamydomonas schloesseri]|eukprot:KAG2449425.1 hypothetical protein HYH02_005572 [Chlamydomonas schloesseri]